MKIPRRQFLQLIAGAAALPAVTRFAWAQTYPATAALDRWLRPRRERDIMARLMGQYSRAAGLIGRH